MAIIILEKVNKNINLAMCSFDFYEIMNFFFFVI